MIVLYVTEVTNLCSHALLTHISTTLLHLNNRPVLVFTHAPPMGAGIRVVQNVHIKVRMDGVKRGSGLDIYEKRIVHISPVSASFVTYHRTAARG